MAEKPSKWTRQQNFLNANTGDVLTVLVALFCAGIFVMLAFMQWNMSDLVNGYLEARLPRPAPVQPELHLAPGETAMTLYPGKPVTLPPPAKPAPDKKKP